MFGRTFLRVFLGSAFFLNQAFAGKACDTECLLSQKETSSFGSLKNGTFDSDGFIMEGGLEKPDPTSYWMVNTRHGSLDSSDPEPVFRNVKRYGAVGNGEADDTDAFIKAATAGHRCMKDCAGTSVHGVTIYVPPGRYRISRTVLLPVYTQLIGDPIDRPVLVRAPNFEGRILIDTNKYIEKGNGKTWYLPEANFFHTISSIIFDLETFATSRRVVALHWQVAQGSSLRHLTFYMRNNPGAVGISMENGSGGFASDLEFFGGGTAWEFGNQQFTARSISIYGANTGIEMSWDWGLALIDPKFTNCGTGISLVPGAGSISIVGGEVRELQDTFIKLKGGSLSQHSISLKAVLFSGQGNFITQENGESVKKNNGIMDFMSGRCYAAGRAADKTKTCSNIKPLPVPAQLMKTGGLVPFYTNMNLPYPKDDVVNVLDAGVENNSKWDQTAAINRVLEDAVKANKWVFFPAGIYPVFRTVHIPKGSRIVGEAWPQISGFGMHFRDEKNPRPVVKVGELGDVGRAQIYGMIFTTRGSTPGAIITEWNIKAKTNGDAGMWDSVIRAGGTAASELDFASCDIARARMDRPDYKKCMAAHTMMHMTKDSSGYFENLWVWTADHDMESTFHPQPNITVYTGRGVLIESQGPTWFYGGASEHSQMYQFQLSGAKDIVMGHVQTESPYFQGTVKSDQPFTEPLKSANKWAQDPDFSHCPSVSRRSGTPDTCRRAWGLRVLGSQDVHVFSAGMYSFFNDVADQYCSDGDYENRFCQDKIIEVKDSRHVEMDGVYTVGSREVISSPNHGSDVLDHQSLHYGGITANLARYQVP